MRIIKQLSNAKATLNQIDSNGMLIEVDDELRKKLQEMILDMFLDVLAVCKKHEIQIALIGGSALGAVRHNGFIPWDDDLDVGMTREDYMRFSSIFEDELGEKYILSAPNYSTKAKARFPKVLKKGTMLEEILDTKDKELCKVFIDIFILENVPESRIHQRIKGLYCNALEFISGVEFFYENADDGSKEFYSKASKSNYYIRMVMGLIFSFKSSAKWFDIVDKSIQYKKPTKLLGIATGRKHYLGEILEKDKIFPLCEHEFEGVLLPLFKDQDYYLSNLYGNYMQVPPVEKRERHFIKRIDLGE